MRKFKLLLLLFCGIIAAQAQNGVFSGERQSYSSEKLDNTFLNYTVFQLDAPENMRNYMSSIPQDGKAVRLQLGEEFDWSMQLTDSKIFSPSFTFRVLTENGPVITPFDTDIAYMGTVANQPNSDIRMTITNKWMMGFVRIGDETIFIEPLSNMIKGVSDGLHIVYNYRDVIPVTGAECDYEPDRVRPIREQQQIINDNARGADCVEAEIALAGAFDMVGKYGSTGDVANHILGIMNNTQALYVVHNISYTVVDMVVPASAAADPWSTATCMDNLLPSFRNWGPTGFNAHDVGQLWVNRDVTRQVDGGGACTVTSLIGRASGIGTICTADRYNCCEDWLSNNAVAQAHLSAHELGHDWDGEHGDAVDNNDIMWPNLTGAATSWSAQNITDIASHRDSRNCLAGDDCPCDPDDSNPLAWCQDITIELGPAGSAFIVAGDLDAGSNDACGGVTLDASRTNFDCSHVPDHFVILTVTDGNGNQSFCGSTVSVEDNIDPTADCKNITVQLDAGGNASVTAGDVDDGSSDNCGFTLSLISDAIGFDCDDIATNPNPVTLTITDDSGNTDDCVSNVTVEDNVDPEAECKDISIFLELTCTVMITPDQVDNGSSDACGIASLSVFPNTFGTGEVGDNIVTLTVTDNNGNTDECDATVTVMRRPTTLTNLGEFSGQYSDYPLLEALLIDDLSGTPIPGKTITFAIGSGTSSAVTGEDGIATTTMRLFHAPTVLGNNYTIDTEFADDDPCWLGSTDSDEFIVLQEDARVTYTGKQFASTKNKNTGEATLLLAATVCDISNTPDAGGDADPGDISNATVTFVDRNGGPISPPLPVVPLPDDTTKGTVVFEWNVDIGELECLTFDVGIVVGNYYLRDDGADDVEITICKPGNQFVTGGGFIILESSFGSLAGDDASHCNFGYNSQFIGRNKDISGEINVIYLRTELDGLHTYQIKGLNVASLGVNPNGEFAEFCGTAQLTDLTTEVLVYAEAMFIVKMTDNGNPGTKDLIGIALYANDGGLIFSSNWSGTETLQQNLDGGNIKVHSGGANLSVYDYQRINAANNGIVAEAYPNPFQDKVQIVFTLPEEGRTIVEVININGDIVQSYDLGWLEGNSRFTYDYEPKGSMEVGEYLYRITSGSHVTTGTMILIK